MDNFKRANGGMVRDYQKNCIFEFNLLFLPVVLSVACPEGIGCGYLASLVLSLFADFAVTVVRTSEPSSITATALAALSSASCPATQMPRL